MSARDELYAYGTAAFDTGVPPVVHEHLTKLLDAYKAEVLRQESDAIVKHCPDHGPQDQDGVWMDCHCAVADEMRRRAAKTEAGTPAP